LNAGGSVSPSSGGACSDPIYLLNQSLARLLLTPAQMTDSMVILLQAGL